MGRGLAPAALALTLAAPSARAAGFERFVFEGGLFRCEVPKGWERREEPDRVLLAHPDPAAVRAREVEMTVALYKESGRYRSLDEFLEVNGGAAARPATIGRRMGRRFEKRAEAEDAHLGLARLRQAYAAVPVKGGFYVLALSVRDRPGRGKGAYAAFLPAFERLLRSFEPDPDPWDPEP